MDLTTFFYRNARVVTLKYGQPPLMQLHKSNHETVAAVLIGRSIRK